ncbi:MAG: branched-chain amino acid ABC transporter permease [Planctomycetota bacterium]
MQIYVNGFISGTAIALLALAFQCVYLPTRVFFIGMAGIYAMVPFVAWAVLQAGGGAWLAVPAALIVGVVASLICEWLIHLPMEKKKASPAAHLIASLGASIVLVQITAMIWGNDTKSLRTGLDSVSNIGPVIVTGAQWVTLAVGVGLAAVFWFVLMKSDLGLRLRALADNPTQFALFGYNIHLYRTFAFAVGGTLAAAAALVTAYDVGFDPHTGLHAVLLAVVAVIIGGRGSFVGPVVGGLLLGVIRAQVVWHASARWQEAVTFALLAIVLLLIPHGLLGQKTRLEATE